MPDAIREWLTGPDPRRVVTAEDVRRMLGQFAPLCGPAPRNSGIRGLPPGFPLEQALRDLLSERSNMLTSELDEQGLQVAMLERAGSPLVVRVEEVTICSPFPPHQPHLGRCGAHFVGLNARQLPWQYEGRPAVEHLRDHWQRCCAAIGERIGITRPR